MIFALVFLTILCLSFLAGVIRISCSYGELLGPLDSGNIIFGWVVFILTGVCVFILWKNFIGI